MQELTKTYNDKVAEYRSLVKEIERLEDILNLSKRESRKLIYFRDANSSGQNTIINSQLQKKKKHAQDLKRAIEQAQGGSDNKVRKGEAAGMIKHMQSEYAALIEDMELLESAIKSSS